MKCLSNILLPDFLSVQKRVTVCLKSMHENYYVYKFRYQLFKRRVGYEKLCSASGMFVENRSDNFDTRIRRLAYGFYQRIIVSENFLVKCVVNRSAWLSSKLYANWNKCLYVSQIVL